MASKASVLGNVLASSKKELNALFWFCFAINILLLAMPLYSMQLFDRVLSSRSIETLIMLSVIVVFCLIVQAFLSGVRQSLLAKIGEKVELLLAEKVILCSVRQAVVSGKDRNGQGIRDTQFVANFFSGGELITLLDIPWSPLYLAVIFMLDTALGFVAVVGVVVILILAVITEFVAGSQMKKSSSALAKAAHMVDMIVRQAEAVYAMGMVKPLTRNWQNEQRETQKMLGDATDRINIMANLTRLVRMLLQVAIMVTAVIQVLNATITPGAMIVSNILMAKTLAPAESAIGTWKAIAALRGAVDRLDGMLKLWFDYSKNVNLPPPTGAITAEKIIYSVPNTSKPILRGLTFKIAAGEMIGVVGPSGAGKSTLGRILINALKVTQGSVRLDGAEIVSWDPALLGRHLGYLPQSIELFSGTIAQNIARFNDVPPEQIIEAAKLAGIHDLILQFRRGYDTELAGDEAVQLSGGQRQRIGLARALFGNPKIVVLDEPNANLDSEGERALIQAMATIKAQGATVIIIAHRPSVLAHVDRIMLMRDGVIEAMGTAQEMAPKLGFAQQRPRVVAGAKPNEGGAA